MRELEKRKLISINELGDGQIRIELSHQGKQLIRVYDLEKIRLKKSAHWDGLWHVVIYDIPSSKRKASDAFRSKIKMLGLYPLQKSVWVSPCDCLPELEFIAAIFEVDIDKHLFYFRTKEIPKEKELKKFFEL